ncbi:MAG: roadblock/LC7 domain-containing protein [Actinomycetales bacterium]
MSNVDVILKEAMQIDGAIGVALVDYETGMSLGQAGGGGLDLDIAAAGNADVVKAKLRTMSALGLDEKIEDVLITLNSQYHLLRLITARNGQGLFLYMALDKSKANLAMARRQLTNLEKDVQV